MITADLSDLDELVLQCGEAARIYIGEAVRCYKSGAYRSAIVATWIAVLYDFLGKLRDLDMAGDAKARAKLNDFEAARRSSNWKSSLEFERDVIRLCQEEFELLSPPQADDLRRLETDRNRCAHPSMMSAEEPYQPTAELARTHIKNTVMHLLSHPPVQGKAALDRIMKEVASDYFPSSPQNALKFFRTGPLARARQPLVRNLIEVLSKELLLEGWNSNDRKRRFAALASIVEMYREIGETALRDALPKILLRVSDEELYRAIFFVASIPISWELLDVATQIKLRNYVETAPKESLSRRLHYAVRIPSLRDLAIVRLKEADAEILAKVIAVDPSVDFVDLALKLFQNAGSFRGAEVLCGSLILPLASVFKARHVLKVLDAFFENNQIGYASGIPEMYLTLFQQTARIAEGTEKGWEKIAGHARLAESADGGALQKAVLERYRTV